MKVLLINGSPHKEGTTARALTEVALVLEREGIETEILCVATKPVKGCMACGGCSKTGKCVFNDDIVNEVVEKIRLSDGVIIGSPVYFASLNGNLKCVLDRVFYCRSGFDHKFGAAVAVARRAGTTATLDIINKYFMIANMPIVSSQYWNMVFGSNGAQAEEDIEGLQTMRLLGQNMAWLIKSVDIAKKSGIEPPKLEKHTFTNFIKKQ